MEARTRRRNKYRSIEKVVQAIPEETFGFSADRDFMNRKNKRHLRQQNKANARLVLVITSER